MRISVIAFAALVLFEVTGASGQRVKDDPWSPARINQLPVEVRTVVLAKCPMIPTAGHYFATYFHDQINLSFGYFLCENSRQAFATGRDAYIKSTN